MAGRAIIYLGFVLIGALMLIERPVPLAIEAGPPPVELAVGRF